MSENIITYLSTVLTEQIRFNPSLNASELYDEFISMTNKGYGKYEICERLTDFNHIEKSENLQYLIDNKNKKISVINKFY